VLLCCCYCAAPASALTSSTRYSSTFEHVPRIYGDPVKARGVSEQVGGGGLFFSSCIFCVVVWQHLRLVSIVPPLFSTLCAFGFLKVPRRRRWWWRAEWRVCGGDEIGF